MTDINIADVRGLALTAPSSAVVGQFDSLVDELYYYRPGVVDRLVELLEAFPEFPLAHVLVGYSLMTEGTLDAQLKARARLRQAEALPTNHREQLHQEALQAWINGDLLARAAMSRHRAITPGQSRVSGLRGLTTNRHTDMVARQPGIS